MQSFRDVLTERSLTRHAVVCSDDLMANANKSTRLRP